MSDNRVFIKRIMPMTAIDVDHYDLPIAWMKDVRRDVAAQCVRIKIGGRKA